MAVGVKNNKLAYTVCNQAMSELQTTNVGTILESKKASLETLFSLFLSSMFPDKCSFFTFFAEGGLGNTPWQISQSIDNFRIPHLAGTQRLEAIACRANHPCAYNFTEGGGGFMGAKFLGKFHLYGRWRNSSFPWRKFTGVPAITNLQHSSPPVNTKADCSSSHQSKGTTTSFAH